MPPSLAPQVNCGAASILRTLMQTTTDSAPRTLLEVNGIEVIYNHIILVLKGVSLTVPERGIVALLGGNGAGKTTTLRAISNLLRGECGEVSKGYIDYRGERIENLSSSRSEEHTSELQSRPHL